MASPTQPALTEPRLLIAGASGVVGRHLVAAARERYEVVTLTRALKDSAPAGARPVLWKPTAAKENDERALETLAESLSGARAVVNLAGASIAGGRLGKEHKRRVLESRLDSTDTLAAAFKRARKPPPVWFQASAVHYYGDRGEEALDETAGPQPGFFLSEVCQAWERAAKAVEKDTRLVIGRLGLVLAKDADAWQKLLLPVKLFVGGPLGSGQQWYAWIDADDLARAILHLVESESAAGVYNLSAPEPVRQVTLTRKATLRLKRPALVPAPAFALRAAVGGVADTLLLSSTKIVPQRLLASGFNFAQPDIEGELDELLGKQG